MTNSPSNLIDGVGLLPANDTQQSSAMKKTPLGVHYQNGSFLATHQEPVKIPRNKKLTPENPSNLPSRLPFCNNASNEHIVNARRRFELELGKGRGYSVEKYTDYLKPLQACQPLQKNPNKQTRLKESNNTRVPVATSSNLTPPGKLSNGGPSLPNHLGKNGDSIRAADFLKVSAEIPQNIVSKSTIEQRMSDRFIQLQQFLKQCDESRHRDYLVMLLRLSPPDLSRHAADLERRALRLKIEEGKELQRMNSLNILTKSASEYPM
ncbi:hypothetical protein LIER_17375 [Lithospermum erythrorhizon]|uniref:Uncharacterized protein n=1 Tax=Lithospermum erythrorhizon TaxID=34254 RepID=A0AAV3QCR5_LITER